MKRCSIVLISVAALLLGGCASDSDDGGTGDGSKITLQIEGELEENVVYRSLAESFEKDHPDIDVELVEVSATEDSLAKLTTAFAAGDPPDLFLINYREYAQFANQGAIEPLGDLIENGDFSLDDYYEAPREAFTYEGELQCMPQNISSLVVYYNTKLFGQAGIDDPSGGWTFDEFRAAAKALTKGEIKGLGFEPKLIRLAPFIWSNGGEVVDDELAPTRFTLDEPRAREAIEKVLELVREDKVVPSEKEQAAESMEDGFTNGNVAMFLGSRRDTPKFREILDLEWDVAPMPVLKEPAGILHSDAYCISSGADIDAALEFVRFAVGEQGQTISAFSGRTVPSLQRVAESGAFLDPSKPPAHSQVFLDAIPTIRRTPVIPTWPEIEAITGEIITRAFYEADYSVDTMIEELEEATSLLFEEGSNSP